MNAPTPPTAAAVAKLRRVALLLFVVAVLGLMMSLFLFLLAPDVVTGIVVLVSLANLQVASMVRQLAKRRSSGQ